VSPKGVAAALAEGPRQDGAAADIALLPHRLDVEINRPCRAAVMGIDGVAPLVSAGLDEVRIVSLIAKVIDCEIAGADGPVSDAKTIEHEIGTGVVVEIPDVLVLRWMARKGDNAPVADLIVRPQRIVSLVDVRPVPIRDELLQIEAEFLPTSAQLQDAVAERTDTGD